MRPAHETSDMLFMVRWIHAESDKFKDPFGFFKLIIEVEHPDSFRTQTEFACRDCITNVAQIVWKAVMTGDVSHPHVFANVTIDRVLSELVIVRAVNREGVPTTRASIHRHNGHERQVLPEWEISGDRLTVLCKSIDKFNDFI